VTASQRGKNSPKFINQENSQSDKPYHARSMTCAQRLKRVFNIGITGCEKCHKHNVTIIACITDPHVIQKILIHFDKNRPSSAQRKTILAPMRASPQQDFDLGLSTQTICHYEHTFR
jgi:hypothetical protein